MRLNALLLGSVSFLVTIPLVTEAADRPIVAVFKIEDKSRAFSSKVLDSATEYLAAELGKAGMFQIVPPGDIKRALTQKKKESLKECYEQQCQIELGRELAAGKTLSVTISKIGSTCAFSASLYDLKKMATDTTATAESPCKENSLLKSIQQMASEIRAWGTAGGQVTPKMVAAPQTTTPSTADYEKMAAQADAQEKQKAREREKYLAALEQAWASVKKVAAAESMEKKARIGMVEKFLADFKQDNPHEVEAKALIETLSRVTVAPVNTASVRGAAVAGLVWISSKPAKMEFTKSEITVAQYRECVNAGKCSAPRDKSRDTGCNWGHVDRDNHPINCVDWNQSDAFCRWAEGRLPTQEEWYAEASNGGQRQYPWGNEQVTCQYAIWSQGGAGCGKNSTWAVCSKPKGNSVSGLCDVAGNVSEWTSSQEGSDRVQRGGTWSYGLPGTLRVTDRAKVNPSQWYPNVGFRCGRTSLSSSQALHPVEAASGKTAEELMWVYSKPAKMEFSKSEVTVKQYRECVTAGKCTKPKDKNAEKYCNWGYVERDSHPINCVNWNQANAFCGWAGGRLPTEQEWYAEASNGGKRKYPWGNETLTCDHAIWNQGGGGGCGKLSTWPVCSKPRGNSVSGLCDMSGSVYEWTSSGGGARVLRGGAWSSAFAADLAASYRFASDPTYWSYGSGFRCARSSR